MTRRLSTGRLLTAPAGTALRDEFAHDLILARSACGDFPAASGADANFIEFPAPACEGRGQGGARGEQRELAAFHPRSLAKVLVAGQALNGVDPVS